MLVAHIRAWNGNASIKFNLPGLYQSRVPCLLCAFSFNFAILTGKKYEDKPKPFFLISVCIHSSCCFICLWQDRQLRACFLMKGGHEIALPSNFCREWYDNVLHRGGLNDASHGPYKRYLMSTCKPLARVDVHNCIILKMKCQTRKPLARIQATYYTCVRQSIPLGPLSGHEIRRLKDFPQISHFQRV